MMIQSQLVNRVSVPGKAVIILFGIEVKPYLTVEEIATIADSIMSNTNYITKQKARDLGVLTICTDIEEVKEPVFTKEMKKTHKILTITNC